MNSADTSLTPNQSAWKTKPVSALSGLARPFKMPDAKTVSFGNNEQAASIRAGQTKAQDVMNTGNRGVSAGASQAMYAAMEAGNGSSEGAQKRAGIEAEDQMFNAGQDTSYQAAILGRLNSNRQNAMAANQDNFGLNMTRQQGQWDVARNQQQNWNQMMMSLLSKLS
jgi:hypothetical protein